MNLNLNFFTKIDFCSQKIEKMLISSGLFCTKNLYLGQQISIKTELWYNISKKMKKNDHLKSIFLVEI